MNWYTLSMRKLFKRGAKEPPNAAPDGDRRLAQQLVERGIAAESSGAAAEALQCYRKALEADAQFAPAHMNLGIALHARGELAAAVESHRRAIALDEKYANAYYNLALVHLEAGETLQAETQFRSALRFRPGFPEASVGLADALQTLGRDADALAALDAAIGQRDNYVGALYNASALLRRMGRFDAAAARLDQVDLAALFSANRHAEIETVARQMVAVRPDNGMGWKTLGLVLAIDQRFEEALPVLQKAAILLPSDAQAHNTLGAVLQAIGRWSEAEASFRSALAVDAQFHDAHSNLARVLTELGRSAEAIASCARALELAPDSHAAHVNLALALQDLGRLSEAEASIRRGLQLEPGYHEAHICLGTVLQALGRWSEAEASYLRAVELSPGYPKAHLNLGAALQLLGRSAGAQAAFRRALELKPDFHDAHSNLIFVLDFLEGHGVREHQAERGRWYEQHGQRYAGSIEPHANPPEPGRRLRIGYVSADFRTHSACSVFAPILLGHDHMGFEVVCYSGVKHEDEITHRLRNGVDQWRSTLRLSDEALAEQIRSDRIDILVDLSGHTQGNRLPVFARKPAPVQVTAWGHATGTGVKTIDYFLADPVLVPQEERSLFAEEVVDLPCSLCYAPPQYLPEVPGLPALSGKPFTFGCINRVEKISERTIAAWGRIMGQVPASQLLLKHGGLGPGDPGGVRERLMERLGAAGIGAERVRLIGFTPHAEHLKAYHEVDLGLDPFPQNGGVSTAEALWMGVPVVALYGTTLSGRISASILSVLGMQGWIARSEEDYVRIAVQAACDLAGLARTREQLRARMSASVFGDRQRYTRAVEAAYRDMWRRWCAGKTGAGAAATPQPQVTR